ncbi:hypothetical protein DSCO28_15610 [Desulfosarcina ovata subsp. sediminis]|uniref:Response regulatory domain-containing protein n=1 Tax=Desulfosarcina ovata subsp. sediminis TaxID=885957 RepID=A0A5K7ZL62_9BACT|nr:response regulator transcription factor [Desulfosarcina ovata]BBO80995.1 hypothetical protein DSCO28_15610 [Desulfosarcina ovata subsp. sediminis]
MKINVLFLDDLFSDTFRETISKEQLVWDDNWAAALENAFEDQRGSEEYTFDVVKSGDIDGWQSLVETNRPDIVLMDLYWPVHAVHKYQDERRGCDISLDTIKQIRETFPALPVICYTFKPQSKIIDAAYNAGASFFLEKVALALPEVHNSLKYICIHLLREK